MATIVEATPRHLDVLAGILTETGTGGNLVSDAHLASLATEYDATIVTFDADFGRHRVSAGGDLRVDGRYSCAVTPARSSCGFQ